MLSIAWTTTVHVPELIETNGLLYQLVQELKLMREQIVASIDSIKAEMVRLQEAQVAEAQALTAQVTRIADEVAQWNASGTPVTDAQMTNLETAIRAAADAAEDHAAQIQANSQAISGIIPDEPAP